MPALEYVGIVKPASDYVIREEAAAKASSNASSQEEKDTAYLL